MSDKDPFVEVMDQRVAEKQWEYGDSWKTLEISLLRDRVRQNYHEWIDAMCADLDLEPQKLVDLANLCRFVWRRLMEDESGAG